MKIVVTGASGFIGKALMDHLRKCDYDVVGTSHRRPSRGHVFIGEINDKTDWSSVLTGRDVVIHAAACMHAIGAATESSWAEYHRVNTTGTLQLARQAMAARVKRLVFISTVKVNGEQCVRPYNEMDSPAPMDVYAVSKWEAERGLVELSRLGAMEIVIIRPPLVYGPGVKGNFAAMLDWVRRGVPLPFGAVNNRRSLVGLDNFVDFVSLCADMEKSAQAANEVFFVSDGDDISTPELLHRVALAFNTKIRLITVRESWLRMAAKLLGKSSEADRLLGSLSVDISKARELLGWRPPRTMDEELREMPRHATST